MIEERSFINIIILGLEKAGKTTLIQKISGKEFVETMTTIGMNVEIINYGGYKFQAIDIGGQLIFREKLWPHYTTLAKGVIFVFDIFNKEKINEAKKWFDYITSWISENAILIFLANKIDLKETNENYLTFNEIIEKFELEKISKYPKRSFRIFEISAKTGENVNNSIEWLFDKLTRRELEETEISFIRILDKNNLVIYNSASDSRRYNILNKFIERNIKQMYELEIKNQFLEVDNYKIILHIEEEFNIVICTESETTKNNLQTVTKSLTEIIKNEFTPISNHVDEFDKLLKLILI